jgi:hypothetical protein
VHLWLLIVSAMIGTWAFTHRSVIKTTFLWYKTAVSAIAGG